MKNTTKSGRAGAFEQFATGVTRATGTTPAFLIALSAVLVWAATVPVFHYSETWQLVINTGTTIITFLMVFLIQKAQNKDSLAIQLKLNELVADELASTRLVAAENMTEEEMRIIQKYYSRLSELTKKEESLQQSHSVEEAAQLHEDKKDREAVLDQQLHQS